MADALMVSPSDRIDVNKSTKITTALAYLKFIVVDNLLIILCCDYGLQPSHSVTLDGHPDCPIGNGTLIPAS